MTALSIVIVSYNASQDLARCLASLRDAPPATPHDIIVIDNASTDDCAAVARDAGVRFVGLDRNRGFAAANNVGLHETRGELVLLLNPDTVVPAGALDRLVAILEAHPEAGALGPRLVDGSGRAELSFGPMIGLLAERRQQRLMRRLRAGEPAAVDRVAAMTRQTQWPDWVSGACLLTRRADLNAIGGLDERFFMYTEDVDLCASLRARGRRILFTPEVEIVHRRGQSVASAPAATRRLYARSHIAFYEKHHPRLAPLVRLYHLIRG